MNPFQAFRGRVRLALRLYLALSEDDADPVPDCTGGDTRLRIVERARARGARANTSHSGQSKDTDCVHLLCYRFARACHVHNIRVDDVIGHAAAEGTLSISLRRRHTTPYVACLV